MNIKIIGFGVTFVIALPAILAACFSIDITPPVVPVTPQVTAIPPETRIHNSVWVELLQQTPYPYTTPLPAYQNTILDGIYIKFDPVESNHDPYPEGRVKMPHPIREGVFWFKPVPYPLEGGQWILQLDRGIFRVLHDATGWRTLGSYTVSEDRITFFNDPNCYREVGIYKWVFEAGQLTLEAIDDECDGRVLGGGGLRITNFTSHPWVLENSGSVD